MVLSALAFAVSAPVAVQVRTVAEFRQAVTNAKPGTEVRIASGTYPGGFSFADVHGSAQRPIRLLAADPSAPPVFEGGHGLQFSDVSYLEIRDLQIRTTTGNGLNIDDGGTVETPSHHVTLRNLRISDLPRGNNDGIKLSGLDEFRVENCTVERWGGSGIDMVGCHWGAIVGCDFRQGGDSGVQTKGGSSDIEIVKCRFEEAGERGVNLGGSTGEPFFRPPLSRMPAGAKFEARNISVRGCTFRGGNAPFAFVGVDGATVRFNTVVNPGRWALRILQETRLPGFMPSRNGRFEDNLIVFDSARWASGGVNVGDGTAPETFRFRRNFWFCTDRPDRSRPSLPTAEAEGVYGRDPMLTSKLTVAAGSPAARYGAHALR